MSNPIVSYFDDVKVGVTPVLKGIEQKLLSPIVTLTLPLELPRGLRDWLMFFVECGEFDLTFGVREGQLILQRNELRCSIDYTGWGSCVVEIVCTPTSLELVLVASNGRFTSGPFYTPPTALPRTLPRWLRDRALLEKKVYQSLAELQEELVVQLEHLAEKIRKTAAIEGFWDHHYEGRKLVSSTPKREPEITSVIELHLKDIEYTKNIQVYPEAKAGSGRMDFLFTAPLADGTTGKICVEFKHVHSPDLLDGLMKQLPAYMDNKDTSYGIFAALDFGGEYPPVVKHDIDDATLELPLDTSKVLAVYAVRVRPRIVRSAVLPMVKPPSPSSL